MGGRGCMCSWALCDCSDDAGVFTFDLLTKHHWREREQLYTHTHAHTHAHTALWTIHA